MMKFRTLIVGATMVAGTVFAGGQASAAGGTVKAWEGMCRGAGGVISSGGSTEIGWIWSTCTFPDFGTLYKNLYGPKAAAWQKACGLWNGGISGMSDPDHPFDVSCTTTV